MDITKSNKIVTEFMGNELEETLKGEMVYAIKWQNNPDKLNDIQTEFYLPDELRYNSSWDWLMPVVEKIEETGYFVMINKWSSVYTGFKYDRIETTSVEGGSKIVNTYKAVVDFIKWYNSNSTSDSQNSLTSKK